MGFVPIMSEKVVETVDTKIDYVRLGRRIHTARKSHRMTQEELASRCGCTRNHLSDVENGSSRPSLELLLRIARHLNTGMDELLVDSPGAETACILNTQLTPKLMRCNSRELAIIDRMLDELLEYRAVLLGDESGAH